MSTTHALRPAKLLALLVGLLLALGLAGAPHSDAKASNPIKRLVSCEAGGKWHINTGNGYYGGAQFNLGTWRSLGFKGRPDKASVQTQVRAIHKLYHKRGNNPWPSCGRGLNLSKPYAGVYGWTKAHQMAAYKRLHHKR